MDFMTFEAAVRWIWPFMVYKKEEIRRILRCICSKFFVLFPVMQKKEPTPYGNRSREGRFAIHSRRLYYTLGSFSAHLALHISMATTW